jgi:hypothetical protein
MKSLMRNAKSLVLAASLIAASFLTLVAPQQTFAASGQSTYSINKVTVDWLMRGQTFTQLTNVYVGLFSTCPSSPTSTNAGTELSGNGYGRITVAASLAAWAGTQGSGTTAISSGTSGVTSNNAAITFSQATANWTVNCVGIWDAATSGNLLFWGAVTGAPVTVGSGSTASFAAGALTITWTD